jgi:gamma-glutamylcyclotransferase (GGCT)/AIG2-like uncharacterized protein YtfP
VKKKEVKEEKLLEGTKVLIEDAIPEGCKVSRSDAWQEALKKLLNKETRIAEVKQYTDGSVLYRFSKGQFLYPKEVIKAVVEEEAEENEEEENEATMKLFVYGTLRNGLENNFLLDKKAKFIKVMHLSSLKLYDLGPFPAAVESKNEKDNITGELYEIPTSNIEAIDQLEGVPHMFQRQFFTDEDEEIWYYVMEKELIEGLDEVPSGDWMKHLQDREAKQKQKKEQQQQKQKNKKLKVYVHRDKDGYLTVEKPDGVEVYLIWNEPSSSLSAVLPLPSKYSDDFNINIGIEEEEVFYE